MARPPGVRNKTRRQALDNHLLKKFGDEWSPIVRMAEQAERLYWDVTERDAHNDRERAQAALDNHPVDTTALRLVETAERRAVIDAYKEIAPYLYPTMKAIDVDLGLGATDDQGNPTRVRLVAVADGEVGKSLPTAADGKLPPVTIDQPAEPLTSPADALMNAAARRRKRQ